MFSSDARAACCEEPCLRHGKSTELTGASAARQGRRSSGTDLAERRRAAVDRRRKRRGPRRHGLPNTHRSSLFRSRKFRTPEACLHLYKSTIRPIMEHCCHFWSGAPKSHLSLLDRVQHRMKKLVGSALYSTLEPLSQRRDVASLSLFYRYYFGRCSDGLHTSMFPTFVASRSTRRVNSLHSFCVQVPQSQTVSRSSGFFVAIETNVLLPNTLRSPRCMKSRLHLIVIFNFPSLYKV